MLSGVITNRYAQGLFQVTQKQGVTNAVNEGLQLLAQTLDEFTEYKAILESPVVTTEQKITAVEKVFGDQLHPLTTRVLYILFERGRSTYISAIAQRFSQLVDEAEGKLSVTVETAKNLSADEASELDAKLSTALSKEIHAKVEVNSALLAGYRVRVGNRVLDATLLAGLNQFSDTLKNLRLASQLQD